MERKTGLWQLATMLQESRHDCRMVVEQSGSICMRTSFQAPTRLTISFRWSQKTENKAR